VLIRKGIVPSAVIRIKLDSFRGDIAVGIESSVDETWNDISIYSGRRLRDEDTLVSSLDSGTERPTKELMHLCLELLEGMVGLTTRRIESG